MCNTAGHERGLRPRRISLHTCSERQAFPFFLRPYDIVLDPSTNDRSAYDRSVCEQRQVAVPGSEYVPTPERKTRHMSLSVQANKNWVLHFGLHLLNTCP